MMSSGGNPEYDVLSLCIEYWGDDCYVWKMNATSQWMVAAEYISRLESSSVLLGLELDCLLH